MPTPTNQPGSSATQSGREIQNAQLFAELTERQQMPQASQAFAGLAKGQRLIIEKVGVCARIRLLVKLTFTPKEEEKAIANPGFPYRLIREIALQANGVTGIIDCSGPMLHARRMRVYRNPASKVFKSPKTGVKLKKESQEVVFVIEIPIAHDMLSLIGALLAQNEETQLAVQINWASEEEVFSGSGGVEKLEGEVFWSTTVFSIGSTVQGNNELTVLPDLSAFHGLIETQTPLTGTGKRRAELVRTAGQLLAITAGILNKASGSEQLAPTSWETFALEYGGNKDPLVWGSGAANIRELVEENADDFNGEITGGEGLELVAIDQERDNPTRDLIVPQSLTELRAVIGVPGSFSPSNALILTSQETLYPAV
jgi:hypothetical protein